MKKLLLITVLAILVVAATAQETRKTFCEIVGTGKVLSSKVKIQIDFGQKTSYFGKYKTFMVDESGKKIEFNLKSATKLFSVLLASKRPLITELADKLRLKYPLLPTISPCPTMRLEAIRSIIPISCRRYPKSV